MPPLPEPRPHSRPSAAVHAAMSRREHRQLGGGRYRLLEIAGRGGMAVVWRGEQTGHLGFRRPVAIKQMHEHLADKPLYVEMFAEEARLGAELVSPNIAQIYDFVREDGDFFLIMEWVEGIDLGSFIRHHNAFGRESRWDLVTAIGIGLLRALTAAHERSDPGGNPAPIVHRDVSPHNILITTTGMVKLIDFGLSLARDRRRELTEPGVVKGKMSYLSPEVVAGERPSRSTDIYACGSVLWEALVGRRLFEGATDFDVYRKVRDNQVQPLRPMRRDVPRGLVAVVNRALARRPEERYRSTREMGKELTQVLRSAEAHSDLHGLLADTVADVRSSLAMGRRLQDPPSNTPIAEVAEERVVQESDAELRIGPGTGTSLSGAKRGLLHRLPFFRRR